MNKKDDFVPIENFPDPLNDKSKRNRYSKKFVFGSIFNPDFYHKERLIASKKNTIVFDLDETIRGWDDDKNQGFLRDHLKRILQSLKKQKYRLVIWSASVRDSIQQTLNKYPDFENYFDHIISAESYSFPFQTEEDRQNLKAEDKNYFETLMATVDDNFDHHNGRMTLRPAKDINFLNYRVLVDDDPLAIEEAEKFCFRCLRVFPYKYDNPRGTIIPPALKKIVEKDFETNMVDRICHAADGLPLKPEHAYIIED